MSPRPPPPRGPSPRRSPLPWSHHLLRILRTRSALYLHCKLYALSSLVSLVVARPVGKGKDRVVEWADNREWDKKRRGFVKASASGEDQGVVQRWRRRGGELMRVKQWVGTSAKDQRRYPEIGKTGSVRLGHEPSPEDAFIAARRRAMLPHFKATLGKEGLQESNLPLIAIGGSGGGYRAMLGYSSLLESLGPRLMGMTTWLSGVSGSCWTLALLYAHCQMSTSRLIEHCRQLTSEELHPLSVGAFDKVARSRRGNYFLFGPLIRKASEGGRGGGLMDLYATLVNSYILLPRHSEADRPPGGNGISPQTMQWSRSFGRNGLNRGDAPLPVFTAARIVHEEEYLGHGGTSETEATPLSDVKEDALPSQQGNRPLRSLIPPQESPLTVMTHHSKCQWWSMTPLEIGSADMYRQVPDAANSEPGAFVGTEYFGRHFHSGFSDSVQGPELSLSLLLGHCVSAPAGPLTGYISALLSTLPRKTVMSWLLRKLNNFLRWRRWRRRWANPIRASKEWNPFFGMLRQGEANEASVDDVRKIKLMDAGVSNNLPAHVFYPPASQGTRSHRKADIFLGFDASSDVQSPLVLQRVQDFANDRGLKFWFSDHSADLVRRFWEQERELGRGKQSADEDHSELASELDLETYLSRHATRPPTSPLAYSFQSDTPERWIESYVASHPSARADDVDLQAEAIEHRFGPYYCVVLQGYDISRHPALSSSSLLSRPKTRPDLTYIHIPLLPYIPTLSAKESSPCQFGSTSHPPSPFPSSSKTSFLDPSRSVHCTSYNLLWTRSQWDQLRATLQGSWKGAGVEEKVEQVIRGWVG